MIVSAIQAIPFSFAALFPVINPIGSAVIVLSMTMGISPHTLKKLAAKIAINTFIMLTVVLFTGSWILRFFGISIPIVQIGGGLLLASIGWTMLNQSATASNVDKQINSSDEQVISTMAFYPLTLPITAGAGCIAVTLTLGAHAINNNHDFITSLFNLGGTTIGILLVALSIFLCYNYSAHLIRRLGVTGTQVIVRLSAFVNLCIGLEITWHGIYGLLNP